MANIYPFNKDSLRILKEKLLKLKDTHYFLIPVFAICLSLFGLVIYFSQNNFKISNREEFTVTDHYEWEASENNFIYLEIADTPQEREFGLMNRKSLDENRGMIFIFPDETPRTFWMKDTYVSLDIIFLDSNFKVLNFFQNTEILNEDKKYQSKGSAIYVIEVKSGTTKKISLQEGDSLKLSEIEQTL